jgi:rhodanese-related sulfurtransferase
MTDDETIELGPEQAAELIRSGAQLVDVREDEEVAAGRLADARHIALGALTAQADTISREEPVLFYCRTGSRSAMAAEAFRRAGYAAYNLSGGLVAWQGRGLPLEPEDGYVA